MKQVLSQQEIDSLLNAIDTGEIDSDDLEEEKEDKIKSYDFRRPIKLSKEYINTLYMIFENFSKISGNLISSQINADVEISLGAVEQISYDEFIRSIPRTTLIGLFKSKPLSGVQLLEINPQFCYQYIELMCGGGLNQINLDEVGKKEFTDIEIGILEELAGNILTSFEAAWGEIIDLSTEIDSLETNPQLIQNLSPNEPVILISFSVDVNKNTSFMNICIPFVSFENIMDKLSFRNWFDFEKESSKEHEDVLSEKIIASSVDLEVVLGETEITVDDFLHLEIGDIIQLGLKTTDPLKMYVEDKLHYLVKPGKIKEKLAVEVLQYVEGDIDYE